MSQAWCGARLARAIFCRRLGLPVEAPVATDFTDEAVEALIRHRLGPLAWAQFGESAPPSAARRLAVSELEARHCVSRWESLMGDAAQLLREVPFLVLKGLPLARWLYGDPALRPSRDLDILVRRRDFARVCRALTSAGFEGGPEFPVGLETTFRRARDEFRGEEVDVHVEPWSEDVTVHELFARSSFQEVGGVPVRVPAERDQLRLIAAHYVHEIGDQAIHLLDILLAKRRAYCDGPSHWMPAMAVRDAFRWIGVGEGCGTVPLPWKPLEAFWSRRDPSARIPDGHPGPGEFLLKLYVACLLRPHRAVSSLLRAIWPSYPSPRFQGRGRSAWRLARMRKLVAGLTGRRG